MAIGYRQVAKRIAGYLWLYVRKEKSMNKYIEISFNYSEKKDKEQVEKEKSSKRQSANAYIAYMMIGSYFKNAKPWVRQGQASFMRIIKN